MTAIITKLKKWKPKRSEKLLIVLLILIFLSSLGGSLLQSNFGSIDIEYVSLVDEYGNTVTGKLYIPSTATYDHPAPGVLAAHGMNNDKDTEAPVALELAKRGMVVISVDQHNHADSDIGANSVDAFLGSADGYENDTMGANVMYQFLKNSEFVDGSQIGLIGHSMGGGTVRDLARINPAAMSTSYLAASPYTTDSPAAAASRIRIGSRSSAIKGTDSFSSKRERFCPLRP